MTPAAKAHFRGFLKLRDLAAPENADIRFPGLVAVAQWAQRQTREPKADHDAILRPAEEETAIWMGLLLHLATVDRAFFELAKRMAARSINRQYPPEVAHLRMAGALLVAGDGPKARATRAARDCAIVLAVAVGQRIGLMPTENEAKRMRGAGNSSGCAVVANAVGIEYGAVEAIWKGDNRIQKLVKVELPEDEASDFFAAFFR